MGTKYLKSEFCEMLPIYDIKIDHANFVIFEIMSSLFLICWVIGS
jgi:hypothetical protein